MKLTYTQQILAAKKGMNCEQAESALKAGNLVLVDVDTAMSNDVTAPVAIDVFEGSGCKLCNKDNVTFVLDHFTPNRDIKSAEQCKRVREFARKEGVKNFFDVGQMGIEHALLPEKGIAKPWAVMIGADSHTCTYGALGAFSTGVGSTDIAGIMMSGKIWLKVPSAIRFNLIGKPSPYISGKDVILHIIGMIGVDGALYKSIEFGGAGVKYMSADDRFTICNMAIECGAKNGVFLIDDVTDSYTKKTIGKKFDRFTEPEPEAYERVIDIDLAKVPPTVAFPHLPSNTRNADTLDEDIKIDQVVIGSCTNGRISDLAAAAKVLKGRKVSPDVRTIIIPATNKIYLEAVEKGYVRTFIEGGAIVSTPTCGPCLGGHMGILASGERAVTTTNRNFIGRMGAKDSYIYLASPATAMASAIAGKLISERRLEENK
ncbi:MAG: 3-isopropylmalate dehydratase large subunit [Clostridia bacterium]|nr:3-isopropylmalate dehydratase large subunit [Clostridia bacterium]